MGHSIFLLFYFERGGSKFQYFAYLKGIYVINIHFCCVFLNGLRWSFLFHDDISVLFNCQLFCGPCFQ